MDLLNPSVTLLQAAGPLTGLKAGTEDTLVCLEPSLGCREPAIAGSSLSQGLKLPSTLWLF